MFRLARGKTKTQNGEAAEPTAVHDVSRSDTHFPKWWWRISAIKRLLIIVTVLTLTYGVLYAVGQWTEYERESKIPTTYLPTPEEAKNRELQELKDNPLTSSSTAKEKAAYYESLSFSYAEVGNYQQAVNAFEKRQQITEVPIEVFRYLNAAEYYEKLDNTQEALAVLDKAEQRLSAEGSETDSYYRSDMLAYIERLRERLRQ